MSLKETFDIKQRGGVVGLLRAIKIVSDRPFATSISAFAQIAVFAMTGTSSRPIM
ncbi:MAG: hypothetical protein AAFV59_11375 [Pseudomonadota bacterium]